MKPHLFCCLHCKTLDTSQLCSACIDRLPDAMLHQLAKSRATLLDCVRWLASLDREAGHA